MSETSTGALDLVIAMLLFVCGALWLVLLAGFVR